jgi:DNA-binding CsgD family transcriptional regulator/PAS domain-containing protein
MGEDEKLRDLIGYIYDCAIAPANWSATLQQVVAYIGGEAAAISTQSPYRRQFRLISQWGISPDFQRSMSESAAINPMISMGWLVGIDEPFSGEDALGRENYLKSRFYNEVIAPSGYYDTALTVLARKVDHFSSLSVPCERPISDVTLERLRIVAPHVRRAVGIAELLDVQSQQRSTLSAAFDLLRIGIILVDGRSRIVHANSAGRQLLDQRNAIRRDGDFLACCDPRATGELMRTIERAMIVDSVELVRPAAVVPIGRADGGDLAAWILPLDGQARSDLAASSGASVAVFIQPLGDVQALPDELFEKRFGISPAECRVLAMLIQGMTVRETATVLGISEPTTRTHLQKLLQKTGTNRQSTLIRLAMTAFSPAEPMVRDEKGRRVD